MEEWFRISLTLATFGFFKEFRPSEMFIYEFLTTFKNFTLTEINQEILPIGTYSYAVFLIIIFVITDFCRYKPLITLLGFCGIVIWTMLPFTSGMFCIKVVEVFYGLANALEVAYYTYMYAKVSKEHYPQVTSHARAGTLIGRFIASCTSQIVISFGIMDYRQLNFLTLGALTLATIWSFFLPPVSNSIYFHLKLEGTDRVQRAKFKDAFSLIWKHFKTSFSNFYVIKMSIWWALATCGYTQVCVYIQNLWGDIVGPNEHQQYNGGVEAVLTIFSALSALLAGVLTCNWSRYGELALGFCTGLAGVALLLSTVLGNIWLSYLAYVLFGTIYQFLITICSSEIAKKLQDDCYGLVFGINQLLALILQTILTLVVISMFELKIYDQYIVYSILHLVLGLFFILMGVINAFRGAKDNLVVERSQSSDSFKNLNDVFVDKLS